LNGVAVLSLENPAVCKMGANYRPVPLCLGTWAGIMGLGISMNVGTLWGFCYFYSWKLLTRSWYIIYFIVDVSSIIHFMDLHVAVGFF
jgi:hypothetical protein